MNKSQGGVPLLTLDKILEIAKSRWFKTAELYYILSNFLNVSALGLPLSPNAPLNSPSSTSEWQNRRRIGVFVCAHEGKTGVEEGWT